MPSSAMRTISRRTAVGSAAWSVPVIAAAIAAPAASASACVHQEWASSIAFDESSPTVTGPVWRTGALAETFTLAALGPGPIPAGTEVGITWDQYFWSSVSIGGAEYPLPTPFTDYTHGTVNGVTVLVLTAPILPGETVRFYLSYDARNSSPMNPVYGSHTLSDVALELNPPCGQAPADNSSLTSIQSWFTGCDLVPTIEIASATLDSTQSSDAVITVHNAGSAGTSGSVEFRVPIRIQYTLLFDPSRSSLDIFGSPYALSNPEWSMTTTAAEYVFTSLANPQLLGGQFLDLGVTIVPQSAVDNSQLDVYLVPGTGGESATFGDYPNPNALSNGSASLPLTFL